MNLLNRLLKHDAWTTNQLLQRSQPLSNDQLDHQFNIGHKTIRGTLSHIIRNIEVCSDLMAGNPIRAAQGDSIPDLIARLDLAADDLVEVSKPIAKRAQLEPHCSVPVLCSQ